jgi:cytochrome P450
MSEDLTAQEVIDRPFEYFGDLRETDPVHFNEKWGGWIVTRYDDVRRVLQDDEHLSLEAQADRLTNAPHDIPNTEEMFPKWIIYLDPPEHTQLRTLIGEAFEPSMIREQQSTVEDVTAALIEDIRRRDPDEIALIEEFAHQLPVRIISRILGLPVSDNDKFGAWSSDIALTLFHHYDAPDRHRRTEAGIAEFADYLQAIVQDRKDDPRDDLITYLTTATVDGRTLDDDEVVATAILLLFAGHETTTKLIANGVLELLRHPEQMALLREEPSLAPQAVEEIIRYHGPSKALTRAVVEDFELRGHRIEAGQRVMTSLFAANRDPRKFDDPDRFDITRGAGDHLGFGHGTHHCLGAPLARLEATVAFRELVRTFPDMELATDEVEWVRSPLVRGPEELRIRR